MCNMSRCMSASSPSLIPQSQAWIQILNKLVTKNPKSLTYLILNLPVSAVPPTLNFPKNARQSQALPNTKY